MKKLFFALSILACVTMFNACSTDVELYADYKDIPVIYGLLDTSVDTNFVRINRAFSSSNDHPINATEVALIEDSCNYPGKLKAYLLELKKSGNEYIPTGRDTIFLDTLTILDKDPGVFYSPRQKVYYTTEALRENTVSQRYRYRLEVFKGNDTITSETGLVGGEEFRIITSQATFMLGETPTSGKLSFKPADNAVFYDVKMVFNYQEKHGNTLENKQVKWNFGAQSIDQLPYESGSYFVTYEMNSLFNLLEDAIGNDTVSDPNHPNVERYFDEFPIDILIAAGGEDLYNYIRVNSVSSYSQSVPDYSNIDGGYGVFSSRVNRSKSVRLSMRASSDLYGKTAWGFKQQ